MKTWKERIMEATRGRNDRGGYLWYSHNKILDIIDKQEGIETRGTYRSLSCYLSGLVASGHLQRAVKPPELSLKVQYDCKKEYLYRQTGKPYARGIPELLSSKNAHTTAGHASRQGHELWRIYRTLPLWFRRMMMD